MMKRTPRLLDLFCGAGGAGMGYYRAGFEIVGVDIRPQPRYPFEFRQGDALDALRAISPGEFDAIHASPPCQAYSATRTMWNNPGGHPELVEPTRHLLKVSGLPWVMENVPGAPLDAHIILCGTMFGLVHEEWELRRHRLFEISGFFCLTPQCHHGRGGRRTMSVAGNGGGYRPASPDRYGTTARVAEARGLMGIDWMIKAEISQAVPPAYTEHIGRALMAAIRLQ